MMHQRFAIAAMLVCGICAAQDAPYDSARYAWTAPCDTSTNTLGYTQCICRQYALADSLVQVEFSHALGGLNRELALTKAQLPMDTVAIKNILEMQALLISSQDTWKAVRDKDRGLAFLMNQAGTGRSSIACFEATLDTYDRIRRLRELLED